LSAAYNQVVSVQYATANGSAFTGADYEFDSGIETFSPGETCKTVDVTILEDQTDEVDENFFVNLTNAVNGTITKTQGTVTIVDNDDPTVINPFISIEDKLVDEGAGSAVVQICLSSPSNQPVSVLYSTFDGTADDNVDYVDVNTATATVAAGQTCTDVNISILEDQLDEPNETFFINLSNAVGGVILDPQSTVTIVDNDLDPCANLSGDTDGCLLYTSPSPRDRTRPRMPSSA